MWHWKEEIYIYGKSDGKFDGCIGRRGRILWCASGIVHEKNRGHCFQWYTGVATDHRAGTASGRSGKRCG